MMTDVILMKFIAKNPPHRQALSRYHPLSITLQNSPIWVIEYLKNKNPFAQLN